MTERAAEGGAPQGRRWLSLVALFASVLSFSISFGGLVPWMALVLDGRGTDTTLIGVVSAANPLGVILAAPLVPGIVQRFGAAHAMIASGVIGLFSILFLAVFDSIGAWLTLRLVSGLAGSILWVISETWINVIAGDRTRGRVVALYGTVMAVGFAAGPLVLTVVGTEGMLPVTCFVALYAAALVPIFLVRRLAPPLGSAKTTRISDLLRAMPLILAAAFLSGAVDTAFFSFLPIWGLRSGLDEAFAVTLLSIFIAGNIVLHFPLGWLADAAGYRRVMTGCGFACILGPILALQSLETPLILGAVMFLWGGMAWGVYAIALAALGERFKGGSLAAANAAFVMVYTLANISGPPLAGAAIEVWNPHGLMVLMLGFAAAFTVLALLRSFVRRPR
jgi:MFS family permease